MSLAIVDAHGHLMRFERRSNAGWVTVDLAQSKARASSAFNASTTELARRWAEAAVFTTGLIAANHGQLLPCPGGEPICIDGELLGAIGASGGTGAQDAEVVSNAIKHIRKEK